ncbi:lantibiotic dehydratase [Flexivirga meconopsidis]|uniref:lantibiotic dehydratase n=1 Tax=Flexivirga meconopsidis TaxID=2977121 RepID=UPI00223EBAF8|nr:lantibiotic dehydratase [Flexivirga meconopsidis]
MTQLIEPIVKGGNDFGAVVPLGDTRWRLWKTVAVRSAGFAVEELAAFGDPELAEDADQAIAGNQSEGDFADKYAEHSLRDAELLHHVCADSRFRLAIAWQNRPFLEYLDKVLATPIERRNSKARARERIVARYWQRYCSKAETIGFFGPIQFVDIDPDTPTVAEFRAADELVDRRHCAFEAWAVLEVGEAFARRAEVRRWLPPYLRPDLSLQLDDEGGSIVVPGRRPERLTSIEAWVVREADGDRTIDEIASVVAETADRPVAEVQQTAHAVVQRLARKRLLTWGANLPIAIDAEQVLDTRIGRVGEPRLRAELFALWGRLKEARDGVARAGTAEQLVAAFTELEREFVAVTGKDPTARGQGKAYAGRDICVEDTTRAGDLTIGPQLLDAVAEPLAMLADSANWFSGRLAQEYTEAIESATDRVARTTDEDVPLAEIWAEVLRMFWGEGELPLHRAQAALADAWGEVLAVGPADLEQRAIELSAAECADRFAAVFGTMPAPGWRHAAIHSPDLQVCARSVDDLAAGRFTVVVGELHACIPSLDTPAFTWSLDEQQQVRRAVDAQCGGGRVVPAFPFGWRRNTGRFVPAVVGPTDTLVGFSKAPLRDRGAVLPVGELALCRTAEGHRVVRAADGREWSIAEFWGVPLSIVAADAFKVGLGGRHVPRVSLDGLVIFRETWKVLPGDLNLIGAAGGNDARDYRSVRAWQRHIGLPDRVFAKFPGEEKPVFFDLTSPVFVAMFAAMTRAAERRDPSLPITVSEMLPEVEQTWLPGPEEAQTYVSELRVQLVEANGLDRTETGEGAGA